MCWYVELCTVTRPTLMTTNISPLLLPYLGVIIVHVHYNPISFYFSLKELILKMLFEMLLLALMKKDSAIFMKTGTRACLDSPPRGEGGRCQEERGEMPGGKGLHVPLVL